jgi:hypothetical protein
MSYEGFEEGLCEAGHYHSWDCMDDPPITCGALVGKDALCNKLLVWWNAVDQTNDDGKEFQAKLEVLEESVAETCSHCQHTAIVKNRRYKIPTDQGHQGCPPSFFKT